MILSISLLEPFSFQVKTLVTYLHRFKVLDLFANMDSPLGNNFSKELFSR